MPGETKYVKSGDAYIAYQVTGDGPFDLVYVPGWVSHVELAWEEPTLARFLERLGSFSRLITFDKRGTGLSDRVSVDNLPNLGQRMDDLRAVMDAAGSERAAILGFSEGGNMCALFAATYPHRTKALIMCGTFAKRQWSPDYPWAPTIEERKETYKVVEQEWGSEMDTAHYVPSMENDKGFMERLATYFRRSASPSAAVALLKMNTDVDVRNVLPSIHVPTLVIHRTGDRDVNIEEGRWIAAQIPGAKFVELPGEDHMPWVGDQDAILDEIEEFLTGVRPTADFDTQLITMLFTDIVGSTELAASIGDKAWAELLDQHNSMIRRTAESCRGTEVDTTGDGFLLTFDRPANAVRCASRILEQARAIGLYLRAGIHTGEVHKVGKQITGLSIHVASRIVDLAEPGEVLVSGAVKNLVAGSKYEFEDRGEHTLKGVPRPWKLYALE